MNEKFEKTASLMADLEIGCQQRAAEASDLSLIALKPPPNRTVALGVWPHRPSVRPTFALQIAADQFPVPDLFGVDA